MKAEQVILYVDDEFLILDCMRSWLDDWFGQSHVIEVAESGEEALEVIEEHLRKGSDLCLVVSDYIMPRMKGDELLTRVRELSPDTAVIMVTGQIQPDVLSAATSSLNMFQCLNKPWSSEELNAAITAALEANLAARAASLRL